MKRDFDQIQPSNYINSAHGTDGRRVLWVPQSIINWCPWTDFPRNSILVEARMNEIHGVLSVEVHINFEGKPDGYDLILDEDTPEAIVKMRLLKAIDFWAMFPDAWDGGRASAFVEWSDGVETCVF